MTQLRSRSMGEVKDGGDLITATQFEIVDEAEK